MNEMAILLKTVKEPIIEPFIPEILALVDAFGISGQSGGSAGFTASAIAHAVKTLCMQNPVCDITGIDMEWVNVGNLSSDNNPMFQNKRCSAVFKDSHGGRAYYLDAIVKKTPNGHTWSGPLYLNREDALLAEADKKMHSKLNIGCKQYIKSFPFKPKTFYIDVMEEEIAKDDWIMWVKNPRQLDKVWKYYDPINPNFKITGHIK